MRVLLHKIQRSDSFIIRTDNLNRINITLRHIDGHIYNTFDSCITIIACNTLIHSIQDINRYIPYLFVE